MPNKSSSKAPKIFVTMVVVTALIGFLTYKMLQLAQVECSLCLSFKGKRHCSTAFGPNREEAIDEAHRNACAVLAQGVTEVLACNRVLHEELRCNPPD